MIKKRAIGTASRIFDPSSSVGFARMGCFEWMRSMQSATARLAYAPPNATKDQITAVSNLAAHIMVVSRPGSIAQLRFRGVEGTLPDVLASIPYDGEPMAPRFLALFAKQGSAETSSRALAESLIDFLLSVRSGSKAIRRRNEAHVIEDETEVNYGIESLTAA
jgi:hypothetical protein